MKTYLRDKLKRYKKSQIILFVVYFFISIGIIAFEEFKLNNYLNIILFTQILLHIFICISIMVDLFKWWFKNSFK